LTTTQKIVPLLKAINHEIPWQIIAISIICLTTSIVGSAAIPVFIADSVLWDFILRRVVIGFVIAVITFLVCGFTYMTIEDKIMPIIRKIKEQYEKEALEQKKKILEDAEVEMLKK